MRGTFARSLAAISLAAALCACDMSGGGDSDGEYQVPEPPFGIGYAETGGDALLYIGRILTPTGIVTGEMLVSSDGIIRYIGPDSSGFPESETATRLVCAHGLAVPGLIDAWRHLQYAGLVPAETAGERYEHRHNWRTGSGGHTEITFSATNLPRRDEVALIVSGTTSVGGPVSGTVSGMVRNLTTADDSEALLGLTERAISDSFPLDDSSGFMTTDPTAYPGYPSDPDDVDCSVYSAIVGEGVNPEARCEFLAVTGSGATGVDILSPRTSIVHGTALLPQDFQNMAQSGTTLIWTPRSDLYLYGNTASVTAAAALGCNIALASTWTLTGSPNLLEELKTARFFNREYLDGYFSDGEILEMATRNAALAFHVEDRIGALEPGKIADFVVLDTREHSDLEAVFQAELADIAVVFRGGAALYGDAYLVDTLRGTTTGSETIAVDGSTKRIFTVDEFGVTLDDLSGEGLFPYVYDASSIATEIVPARSGEYTGEISAGDMDGDGIENSADNCPLIFNPVRPVDGGVQGDQDGDGIGDAADPSPLG